MSSTAATRRLLKSDLDRVVGIDGAMSGRQRRAFYTKKVSTASDSGGGTVALVAEREGRIVGFVFAHVLDGEFGGTTPVGVLDAIGIAPAARREGNGGSLLRALEEALAARGVRELRTQAEWSEHELVEFFAAAGFRISPRLVLERPLDRPPDAQREDEEELPVRSMTERDLRAIVQLDKKITGRDRSAYYARKADEVLKDSGIRVSLVAEVEGQFAGFLMARVDFGEYGRTEPTAVLDTIGVAPAFARRHVGRALLEQLLLNLASLRVERVVTEVEWNHFALLQFLAQTGFVPSQRLSFTKSIG